MSRERSIFARARPLMLGRIVSAGLMFLVPVALARVLPVHSFGSYKQLWLIVATLHYMLPMGITMSLYYFVPRQPEQAARWVGQTLALTTIAGVAGAVLVLALGPAIRSRFGNDELSSTLFLVALAVAFTVAGTSVDIALTAVGRVRAAAATRVLSDLGRGAAMLVGAWITGSLVGVAAGLAAAAGARAVLGGMLLWRSPGLCWSSAAAWQQVRYALPLGLAALLVVPQQSFHQWAVAAAVSPAVFAVYAVGCFQLPVVDILYTPVSELLQIGIGEEERRGRRTAGAALFRDAVASLAFVFVPAVVALVLLAPGIVALLFTDAYLDAVPVMRVSVLMTVLAALPIDGALRARNDQRFMLASSAAKLLMTVIAVTAGLRGFGVVGAMAGYLVAEAVTRAAQLARVAHLFATPVHKLLPLRQMSQFGTSAALAAPLSYIVANAKGPLLVRIPSAGVVFGATYVFLMAWRGWLPNEWREMLLRVQKSVSARRRWSNTQQHQADRAPPSDVALHSGGQRARSPGSSRTAWTPRA